jgi:apolipoprotein N-acyltransferase
MPPASSLALPAPTRSASGLGGVAARLAPVGLAATGGVLYSLAQPPADLAAACCVCLLPLLRALAGSASWRGGALAGFTFALVFSALTANWLPGAASTFFGLRPALGWPIACGVYVVYAGVPFALFGALARPLVRAPAGAAVAGIPALLVAAELLRTHIAQGLPWALLGHALARTPVLVQVADLAGALGVSWTVALVNVVLFVGLDRGRPRRARLAAPALAAAVVAAVVSYGRARLAQFDAPAAAGQVTVGVLQPNLPPVYHATTVAGDRALLAHVRLSQQYFHGQPVDLIVWPESALPLYVAADRRVATRLRALASALDAPLIVGAPATDTGGSRYFNAAHLVQGGTDDVQTYRKRRLVPFAERRLAAKEPGAPTFAAADAPTLFEAAGLRWGPTICLDLIYADVVRATVRAGADVLLNLSNDSWLAVGGPGATAQQLAQAIFRAIENRRDLVRATSTGISAVVSASGRPRALLADGEAGGLVVPVEARRTVTTYTTWGDVFALGATLVGVGLCWRRRRASAGGWRVPGR